MLFTYIIIGINAFISYKAYIAFKENGDTERYLFAPYKLSRGMNFPGVILSQFSHADFGHFIFNMVTLYSFGRVIEILLGIPVYFLIYTISGISAVALTYILRKNEIMYRALGASGCIVGILFAAIVIAPEIKVGLIFIPVQIPGPFFALIYVAFSLLFMGGQGNIGHEAHLGGALAGFLLGGYFSPNGFTPIIEQFYRIFS